MKHSIQWAVKKFWGGLAVLLLLLAIVIQGGRLLAPLVSEHKSDIESFFSKSLGAPLNSETLSFDWRGLRPELKFSQLHVTNPEGESVLKIADATVKLNLLKSLFSMSPQIWSLFLEGVEIKLTQNAAGGWLLIDEGPEDSSKEAKKSSRGIDPIAALLNSRYVNFQDVSLDYHFSNGRTHKLVLTEMNVESQDGFHRLAAKLDLPEQSDALVLLVEGKGNLSRWRDFDGVVHVDVNNYLLRDSIAIASEKISLWEGVRNTRVNSELWLTFTPGEAFTVAGNLQLLRPHGGDYAELPNWLDTDLWGRWSSKSDWQLQLQSLQFESEIENAHGIHLIAGQTQPEVLTVFLPSLDLGRWGRTLAETSLLSENVTAIFDTLSLSGYAQNVSLDVPIDSPLDFHVQGNLKDASLDSWKGIPRISGLSGYIEARKNSGLVEIDSPNSFLMHYPQIYQNPFEFNKAEGAVAWSFDEELNEVLVNSSLLSFEGDLGVVNGYFLIDAPFTKGTRSSDMTLHIGLQHAKAVDQRLLVPYTSPEGLTRWLDESILSGTVPDAGFIYRGSITGGDNRRTMQLGLNVQGGALDYFSGWPSVNEFDAGVLVDDSVMVATVHDGEFLNGKLSDVSVLMDSNPFGKGALLRVKGGLKGPAQDLMRVLNDTPLRGLVGDGFSSWTVGGDMTASLDLGIPLSADQPGLTQDVTVELERADLGIHNINLTIDDVTGSLNYSSESGLSADALAARLWEQPLQAVIKTELEGGDKATHIGLQGQVDMAALAQWSSRPEIKFAQGVAEVEGSLWLPMGEKKSDQPNVRLTLHSDLKGVSVDLPKPFKKSEEVASTLEFSALMFPDNTRYQLSLNDQLNGLFNIHPINGVTGEVAILESFKEKSGDHIWITGHLPELSQPELMSAIKRYQHYSDEMTSSPGEPTSSESSSKVQIDAQVGQYVWGDVALESLSVTGGQNADGWLFGLSSDILKGTIELPNSQQPMSVSLDYLHIGRADSLSADELTSQGHDIKKSQSTSDDWLSDTDLSGVVATKVAVNDFSLYGKPYGQWNFEIKPVPQGVLIDHITGHIKGVSISAVDSELVASGVTRTGLKPTAKGASLMWTRGEAGKHQSQFSGTLSMTDIGGVLEQWGQPKSLNSQRTVISADLGWLGSPIAMSLTDLEGRVEFDLHKGSFNRNSANAESALLRLAGLFNFDSWVRRLKLDFTDVYKSGLAYDRINGEVLFDQGLLKIQKPIKVATPSSELQMGGEINLLNETLNASLVATLPVGGNITTAAAFMAGLPAAAGVYLISKLLDKQIKKLTSVSYKISGPWSNPEVKFDKLFDVKAAKKAGKKTEENKSNEINLIKDAS